MPNSTSTGFFGSSNPAILAQQRQMQIQQAIADQLSKSGSEDSQTQFAGGLAVPQSPAVGLGKMSQTLAGSYISKKNQDLANKLATDSYNANASLYGANPYPAPTTQDNGTMLSRLADSIMGDDKATSGALVGQAQPAAPDALATALVTDQQAKPQTTPFKLDGFTGQESMILSQSNPEAYAKLLENQHHKTDKMIENDAYGIKPKEARAVALAPVADQLGNGTVGFDDNGVPTLTPTPGANAIKVNQKQAEAEGVNIAEADKTAKIMESNLPQVLQRFEDMRNASDKAGYGTGNNNEGTGTLQQWHKNFLDSETGDANAILQQRSAQGILPELGPQLAQAGIKGNKFLETIASNASGLDLAATPKAKKDLVNGLENTYINNLKATNAQLRAHGKPGLTDEQIDQLVKKHKAGFGKSAPAGAPVDSLARAKAAIAGGAPREAVIERLRQNGIDPAGL